MRDCDVRRGRLEPGPHEDPDCGDLTPFGGVLGFPGTGDAGTGGGTTASGGGSAAGGDVGTTGGGSATGGGHSGGGTGGGTATGGGSGVMGSSCANPIPLVEGAEAIGEIDTAGEQVHYAVAVTAGDFLRIATLSNPHDTQGRLDTALTVYDATGANVLATCDDSFPRVSTDTLFYYRVATTQTICVRIEDFSSWHGDPPMAHPGDTYNLTVTPLVATDTGNNFDTEPNDMASSPQVGKLAPFTTPGGFAIVYGTLATATDVDIYRFTAATGAPQLNIEVPPLGDPYAQGVSTYGSTLQRFAAKVTTADGNTVLGQVNLPPVAMLAKTTLAIGVPVTAGTDYLVWFSHPTGVTAGANDFYATNVEFLTEQPARDGNGHRHE